MGIGQGPVKLSGTYVLILRNPRDQLLHVGSLGLLEFSAGVYAYVGSAFGPGGIASRCKHHKGISSKPHWHIDYLRAATKLEQIWFSHDLQKREHQWSDLLVRSRGASQPHPKFGASDCACYSHLFHFNKYPSYAGFCRRASRELKGQEAIRIDRIC